MDNLATQLIGIFQKHVHIHASRARGEEANVRKAVLSQNWLILRYLLREMSDDPFPDDDPAFSYPKGMIHWGKGERDEALDLLDNATRHFAAQQQHDYAALCQIETADICQERSEFLTALHAIDRANAYLGQSPHPQPRISARLRLLESVLAADTGQMQEGIRPATDAQAVFHADGDANSEFLALMHLANLNIHQGHLEAGRTYLQLARRCYTSGPVLARYEVRLGNTEVHLVWYTGEIEKALGESTKLQRLCKQRGMIVQWVYACELEGNLHRALGQFELAERAYVVALDLAAREGLLNLQRWVWANRSWLYLLQGRIPEARHLLDKASRQADSAAQMNLQVTGAIINLLAGHTSAAERALYTSREFYHRVGDGLSVCAIDFHLAHLHLRTDRRAAARQRLDEALAWMEQMGLDYFPHWWHPGTVYAVLRFGEEMLPTHGALIQRMLRRHLDQELQAATRREAQVLDFSNGAVDKLLQPVTVPVVRQVLAELLNAGVLRASRFPALCDALGNGAQAGARCYLLCAIFGLYLSGLPRKEIAARVGVGEGVIRHAIREIYERLAPELLEIGSTKARKSGLDQRVRTAGYVDGEG